MTEQKAIKYLGRYIFSVLWIFYAYVHQSANPIALGRLDLLYSLVLHGERYIDRYHDNTSNKSIFDGHYYSDKAPLTTIIALPAFVVSIAVQKAFNIDAESPRGWRLSSWIACACSVGLLTALGGFFTFRLLLLWVGVRSAFICTLGIYLGAAPFPYSTVLLSHALTVSLLTIGLYLLHNQRVILACGGALRQPAMQAETLWAYALCGLFCGLAIAAEYSCGLVAVIIILSCARFGAKRLLVALLGALFGLIPIPLYHILCFGNPFSIAYGFEAQHFAGMREGFFGIHFPPTYSNIARVLFGLDYGLIVWTPLFAMSLFGFSHFLRRDKTLATCCCVVGLLHLVAMSGYTYLFASPMIASRLLAPIIPLLIIPTGLGVAQFPRTGAILAGLSVLLTGGATLVTISFSGVENPIRDYYWPALINGEIAPNLGKVFGVTGLWSLMPLVPVALTAVLILLRLSKLPKSTDCA